MWACPVKKDRLNGWFTLVFTVLSNLNSCQIFAVAALDMEPRTRISGGLRGTPAYAWAPCLRKANTGILHVKVLRYASMNGHWVCSRREILSCHWFCNLMLIFHRWHISNRRMKSYAVIKDLYIFKNSLASLGPCLKTVAINKLALQCSEKWFHTGVVIAVTFAAHACNNLVILQGLLIIMACILVPTVRVVNKRCWRPIPPERLP